MSEESKQEQIDYGLHTIPQKTKQKIQLKHAECSAKWMQENKQCVQDLILPCQGLTIFLPIPAHLSLHHTYSASRRHLEGFYGFNDIIILL